MVEPLLYASFGALLATLLGLLFLPAFWSRAVRLTTRRLVDRLPVSIHEIVASQDRLRAEQAMQMRAVERRAEQATARAADDRVEAARAVSAELDQRATLAELRARVAELEVEHERVRGALDRSDAEASAASIALKAAYEANETTRRDLEAAQRETAEARLAFDQSRIEAAARDAEIASLTVQLDETKRERDRARDQIAGLESREAGLAERLKTEGSKVADAEAARALAERKLADEAAAAAALKSRLSALERPDPDSASLKALRVRLDEVADQIVKAAGTVAGTPPLVQAPASQAHPDDDGAGRVSPVAQSAGAR
jgi:chromosome segregation ATPase